MVCKDVSAETMYDVLHDIEYRRKWDTNVIETFDIGKLTVNADVGYYSCMSHSPVCKHKPFTGHHLGLGMAAETHTKCRSAVWFFISDPVCSQGSVRVLFGTATSSRFAPGCRWGEITSS